MPVIDEEKRREWLRALRRFKYGIGVRAKLGVLQTYCEQVGAERVGTTVWSNPDWDHDKWIDFLCECIRDGRFPPDLLHGFAQTAEVTFFSRSWQPTVDSVLDAVNQVCKEKSRELRKKFGVIL
jgi:hypothetical protein